MATQNFPLDTADDQNFVTDRGDFEDAINSLNELSIGSSAPSDTPEGKKWLDSSPTRGIPKLRTDSTWYRLSYADGWQPVGWTVNNVSDASTLVVAGDRTSTLEPNGVSGRMVQVVQPTNGTVYAPVDSTSYDSNNDETTVNVTAQRSQDLDSGEGVDELYYGEDRPDEKGPKALTAYEKQINEAFYTVQSAKLDLTGTNQVDLVPSGAIPASSGGDAVLPWAVYAVVTTAISADNTAPVVEVQDGSNNGLGLKIDTFSDGDSVDLLRLDDNESDNTALTNHDSTSSKIQAKVSTAAADSGTASGKVKLLFVCWPMN